MNISTSVAVLLACSLVWCFIGMNSNNKVVKYASIAQGLLSILAINYIVLVSVLESIK